MAKRYINPIKVENAHIIYRDFSGLKSYNNDGKRTFVLLIDSKEYAELLSADGWAIKTKQPKKNVGTEDSPMWIEDDAADPQYQLNVTVRYENYPPEIYLVSPDGKVVTPVNESNVNLLDKAWIRSVDAVITPYFWTYGKKSGITAYLQLMYVQLDKEISSGTVDPFKAKYGGQVIQAQPYIPPEPDTAFDPDDVPF